MGIICLKNYTLLFECYILDFNRKQIIGQGNHHWTIETNEKNEIKF